MAPVANLAFAKTGKLYAALGTAIAAYQNHAMRTGIAIFPDDRLVTPSVTSLGFIGSATATACTQDALLRMSASERGELVIDDGAAIALDLDASALANAWCWTHDGPRTVAVTDGVDLGLIASTLLAHGAATVDDIPQPDIAPVATGAFNERLANALVGSGPLVAF